MCPENVGGMANSVDPDQTAPFGAGRSGSALFAQTCPKCIECLYLWQVYSMLCISGKLVLEWNPGK